jgi:flagellar protein FliS
MMSSPVGLVALVYDKLLQRLLEAQAAFTARDIPARAAAISRAIELVELGLISALDDRRGGDVAVRLRNHYELWVAKLFRANMQASPELLVEIESEVRTIKLAWDELKGGAEVSTPR